MQALHDDEHVQQHRLLAGALPLSEDSLVMLRGQFLGWYAAGRVAAEFWRAAADALGGDLVFRFDFGGFADSELTDLEAFLRDCASEPGPTKALYNDLAECVGDEIECRRQAVEALEGMLES